MFFIFIKAPQGGRQAREQEVKSSARWVLFSLPSAQAFFFQPMKQFVFSVASRATGRLQIKPSGSGDENESSPFSFPGNETINQ